MRYCFYCLVACCFISCASNTKKVVDNQNDRATDTIEVVDEDIFSSLLDNASIASLRQLSNSGKYKYYMTIDDSENINDRYERDTTIVFFNDVDTFTFGKAYSGIFLWKFQLKSNNLEIATPLNIGISKSTVSSIYHLNATYSVLWIRDEMGGNNLYLTFTENVLTQMNFIYHFHEIN